MFGAVIDAQLRARSLNLIGLIPASSFDVHAHSVNALTEELAHFRFSVRHATDVRKSSLRI
jgi:hypothetical protein